MLKIESGIQKSKGKMKQSAYILLSIASMLISSTSVYGELSKSSYSEEAGRCRGTSVDTSRLVSLQNGDESRIMRPGDGRSFTVLSTQTVLDRSSDRPIGERIRLQEKMGSFNIHGANAIVLISPCGEGEICPTAIEGITGKTYDRINITTELEPTKTEEEAKKALVAMFNTNIDGISDLTAEIYPTQDGDFMAYIGEVFVESVGQAQLYDVVIDANNLNLIQSCARIPSNEVFRRRQQRRLRAAAATSNAPISEERDLVNCQTCATSRNSMSWSASNVVDCQVNTLYLNNNGRTTKCITDPTGTFVAPGQITSLYWDGSYNCDSRTNNCKILPLPTCSDAVSDAQFIAITTLQYYQDYLGVMGGLNADASNPRWIRAFVHYNQEYCNAFYRGSTDTVYFGDCDCSFWTPLTTVDIVAHEISHGVIRYSSALAYERESGGVNEGMADVVGTVVEFLVNDVQDPPDFDIGETLGDNIIRRMEYPFGKSIGSVCEYNNGLDPHHASGPLDLAFVKAARACARSGCASLKDCVILLGTSFMYSNMQGLTRFSGYLDAAAATCGLVDEYFRARSPTTTCSVDQVRSFIREGWCSVNIALSSNCEATTDCSRSMNCRVGLDSSAGGGSSGNEQTNTGGSGSSSSNTSGGSENNGNTNSGNTGGSSNTGGGNTGGGSNTGGSSNTGGGSNTGSGGNTGGGAGPTASETDQIAYALAEFIVMLGEWLLAFMQRWLQED